MPSSVRRATFKLVTGRELVKTLVFSAAIGLRNARAKRSYN